MTLRKWKSMTPGAWACNLALYGIGVGIMPMGVVLTINAHLGAGGYDALNFALAERLRINTSLGIYATAVLVVILTAFIRKGYPRLETFISSFSGDIYRYVEDCSGACTGNRLAASLLIMAAGVVVVAFAVACYIISVFPTNPTDDLVVALHERGIRLGTAKVSLDAVCVILAVLLGGEIGIGTIVCTFGLGPVIDMFHRRIHGKIYGWLGNGKVV